MRIPRGTVSQRESPKANLRFRELQFSAWARLDGSREIPFDLIKNRMRELPGQSHKHLRGDLNLLGVLCP